MEWRELSEVTFGLVLEGRIPASAVRPEYFDAPYDKGIEILSKKGASREDVAKVLNSSYISDAHDAVHKWNGISEKENFDWLKALIESQRHFDMSKKLDKVSKRLKVNEEVDLLGIYGDLQSILSNDHSGLTPLSEIDYKNFVPMMESGWDVLDDIVGGIPKHGLIVVLGETKVGKSFFLGQMVNKFLHKHKKKTAAIFTLEMPGEEYAQRTVSMYPEFAELGDRVFISGDAKGIDDIILEVGMKNVDFVGIDFVDWLIKGEASEASYSYVYRRCVEMGRLLKIPVCLLAQPNREGVKYQKFLTKFDARYTGMAENSAWMFIALQIANELDMDDEKYPLFPENHEYIQFLALRGKWPKQEGPGAVILERSNRKWNGKVKNGRLWTPYATKSSIKRKKKED